ncbi:Myeloid leukemia factor [Trema orientale]|uniref:Myeloid leukemia factor n=1 Tax=Trema orientale TaxID=63057 RepID=A0A2P5F525_TREOI|nr:Myeloid leukemia factor [Trema orientale]
MQGGRGRGQGGRPSLFDANGPFGDFGPFPGFGGLGGPGSLFSSVFGGRNPFDDPFFNRPFGGGMFDSSFFGPLGNPFPEMPPVGFIDQQAPEPRRSRGPIIEEINSDDEEEDAAGKERDENPRKHRRLGNGPYVQEPDDEAEDGESKHLQYRNDYNRFNRVQSQPQTRSFNFQSSSVTYGGANGAYYTSSQTRRTGSDGVTFEESKEADTASRQATHKISRGLHNKGHSLTRKLNSDGKVDTMQTLHNLDEDELSGFEEAWKGSARKHLPGLTGNLSGYGDTGPSSSGLDGNGGWALPSSEPSQHSGRLMPDMRDRVGAARSQRPDRMKAAEDPKNRSSFPRGRAGD